MRLSSWQAARRTSSVFRAVASRPSTRSWAPTPPPIPKWLPKQVPPTNPQDGDFPPGLSHPALRALANAGYSRLDQLSKVTESELGKLHGMGPSGIRQLRAALADKGLSFAAS
jgi:hypothetical protein